MARTKVKATYNTTEGKITCTCCGKIGGKEAFFSHRNQYLNPSLSICKECVHVDEDDLESVLELLRFLNIPFYKSRWEGLKDKNIGLYLRQLAMTKDKYFKDSDMFTTRVLVEDLDKQTNIKTESVSDDGELELNETESKSKCDCIRLLGYDPFVGYEISDQKYLYNELIPYLDEDTVEDPYKISVIVQIVNNNNQIRLTDLAINKLSGNVSSLITNSKDIKELTDVKTKLNQVNDKLSKENNIALKHRGDSGAKNSTLGSIMKNLREMGFEKAEQDYYDMNKAYGIKQALDISHKSILEIINFDEQKQNELFKGQRELIQQLQDDKLKLKDEIRLLVLENNKLKEEQ